MKAVYLLRRHTLKDRILGRLLVFDGAFLRLDLATLELPWKGNAVGESCIPAGRYRLVPRSTQARGDHLLIEGVPGREWILIHRGNYPSDVRGCILVGREHIDINGDRIPDVSGSRSALGQLVQVITEPTELIVVDA